MNNSLLADVRFPSFRGIGPLGQVVSGNTTDSSLAFARFTSIISTTLGILTISAGLWFIFQIFGGAIQWLGSGGEKQSLQAAQKRIANAIVGLLVVVLSYAFISIIGAIVGFDILSPYKTLMGIPSGSGTPIDPNGPGPCPSGFTQC